MKPRIFSNLILVIATVSVFSENLTADVVAHWRFEEGTANIEASGAGSVLDSSGNGLHATPFQGTTTGGPFYRSVSNPNSLLALEFDGVNDRLFIQDDPLFQLTQNLTLEAFIRVDVHRTSQIVFRGDSRGSLDPYLLAIIGDKLVFHVENSSGNISRVFSPSAVPLGEFLHVAGTLDDATGDQRLFINGVEVASTTTTIRPFANLGAFFGQPFGVAIGSLQSGNPGFDGHYFDGTIDEVRISNSALSASQFLNAVPEPSSLLLVPVIGAIAFFRTGRRRVVESKRFEIQIVG